MSSPAAAVATQDPAPLPGLTHTHAQSASAVHSPDELTSDQCSVESGVVSGPGAVERSSSSSTAGSLESNGSTPPSSGLGSSPLGVSLFPQQNAGAGAIGSAVQPSCCSKCRRSVEGDFSRLLLLQPCGRHRVCRPCNELSLLRSPSSPSCAPCAVCSAAQNGAANDDEDDEGEHQLLKDSMAQVLPTEEEEDEARSTLSPRSMTSAPQSQFAPSPASSFPRVCKACQESAAQADLVQCHKCQNFLCTKCAPNHQGPCCSDRSSNVSSPPQPPLLPEVTVERLRQMVAEIREDVSRVHNAADASRASLEDSHASLKADVFEHFQRLEGLVEQRKAELLRQMQENLAAKQAALGHLRQSAGAYVEQTLKVVEFAEGIIHNNEEQQVCRMDAKLLQRFTELHRQGTKEVGALQDLAAASKFELMTNSRQIQNCLSATMLVSSGGGGHESDEAQAAALKRQPPISRPVAGTGILPSDKSNTSHSNLLGLCFLNLDSDNAPPTASAAFTSGSSNATPSSAGSDSFARSIASFADRNLGSSKDLLQLQSKVTPGAASGYFPSSSSQMSHMQLSATVSDSNLLTKPYGGMAQHAHGHAHLHQQQEPAKSAVAPSSSVGLDGSGMRPITSGGGGDGLDFVRPSVARSSSTPYQPWSTSTNDIGLAKSKSILLSNGGRGGVGPMMSDPSCNPDFGGHGDLLLNGGGGGPLSFHHPQQASGAPTPSSSFMGSSLQQHLLQKQHHEQLLLSGVSPAAAAAAAAAQPAFPPKSQIKRQKMIYHCKFGEFGVLEGQFTEPSGVAVNAQNDIIVADTNNHRIQIFDKEGRFKFQFGECGKREGQLLYPNRVAVVRQSGDIVVTERSPTHQVQIYNQYGQFVRKFGANILQHPRGVCVDPKGLIVVVECKVMRVIIFDQMGNVLSKFGCSKHLEFPNGVVVNDRQEIFISDNRAHCVKVFNYKGVYLRQIGGEGITNYPIGVGINAAGEVTIADNHNNFNLSIFSQEGTLLSALESKVKHAQCFDVSLMDDGSVVLASKDYRLYIYRYVQFPPNAVQQQQQQQNM